jgi:hypothetical protein
LIAKERERWDAEVNAGALPAEERDARGLALSAFEDAMVIFRAFSSLPDVYQVAGGVGGKKTVDVKHQTMTALINQLTWTTGANQLNNTLTRIFTASLVNRSLITRDLTTSFQALLGVLRTNVKVRDIIIARWLPDYTVDSAPLALRQSVLDKAALLDPEGGVTEQGAFKKGHQNERLLRLVDEAAARAPAEPATRQQVLAAIEALLVNSKATLSAGPFGEVAKIRLAGQANLDFTPTAEMETLNGVLAAMTGDQALSAFENLFGPESDESIMRYDAAVRHLYGE